MADEIKDGKVDITRYMVKEGEKVNLKKYSTKCDVSIDKSQVKNLYFPQVIEKLKDLQEKLYAQNTYGLVVVLQAMDAAGKDGTINHVFASLNPGGVKVVSFKQPTTEEKDHDYMWRINKALPERGDIGIFNRSQYEDVIVTRIHDLVHQGQLPQDLVKFGLIPELVGRVPVTVSLDLLDKEALIRILTEPKSSLVKQYQKLMELDGVKLEFDKAALDAIAETSLARKTGARGLRAIMEDIMMDTMFRVPSDDTIKGCMITKDVVEGKGQPLYECDGEERKSFLTSESA